MKHIAITVILLISQMSTAHIGNESGGGGPGIFCPVTVNTQPPVQVLDLYEGRNADTPLIIPESTAPFAEQLEKALKRMSFDVHLQRKFQATLATLQRSAKFLPAGVGIHVPSDLGTGETVLVPTGCSLGAIGYYEANGTLKISTDAFGGLSETNKAAFWAHETLYKIIRDNRNPYDTRPITSKSARLLVAYLFSENPDWQQLYYLSNECWRNHYHPYDQLGEWWYNTTRYDGIDRYGQFSNLNLKANDLIQFELYLDPLVSEPWNKGTPSGSIQCWDLNSLTTKDLPFTLGPPPNSDGSVSYRLTIPPDCKILQFNGFGTDGIYKFSIRIGTTGYFYPIFDQLQTVYDQYFAGGIQRQREGFIIRVPIY